MKWSHNDNWMVTADHKGVIKYWQSNMNNLKMIEGHKEAIRDLSCVHLRNLFLLYLFLFSFTNLIYTNQLNITALHQPIQNLLHVQTIGLSRYGISMKELKRMLYLVRISYVCLLNPNSCDF